MRAVPVPDMARLDGIQNLAAHYPMNAKQPPDLGTLTSSSIPLIYTIDVYYRTKNVQRICITARQLTLWLNKLAHGHHRRRERNAMGS
jgi:hypothetical protein